MPDLSAVAASREVTPSSSTLAELQAKADVLSALLDQLRLIRACPNALLNTTSGLHLQKAFNDLQNFAEDVQSPAAQVALATAKKLGTEDPAGIDPYAMRVEERARKRRKTTMPTTQSPGPSDLRTLPPASADVRSLDIASLPGFIQQHNQSPDRKFTLQVWGSQQTRSSLVYPVTLHLAMPAILTAAIRLTKENNGGTCVRNITFFGSQEKKQPHSYSDFDVFKKTTQFFSGVLEMNPKAHLSVLIDLIGTYENMFCLACRHCGMILREEGHLPPVGRVWVPSENVGGGRWVARHLECIQR